MEKKTRKLPMVKRETKQQRAVTFTKRRRGLFNKAAEFCLLFGAQVAILMSSPSKPDNIYSFGSPSVSNVFNTFLDNQNSISDAMDNDTAESKNNNRIQEELSLELLQEFNNCQSVEELQTLSDMLKKLKHNVTTGPNNLDSTNPFTCSNSAVVVANDHYVKSCSNSAVAGPSAPSVRYIVAANDSLIASAPAFGLNYIGTDDTYNKNPLSIDNNNGQSTYTPVVNPSALGLDYIPAGNDLEVAPMSALDFNCDDFAADFDQEIVGSEYNANIDDIWNGKQDSNKPSACECKFQRG